MGLESRKWINKHLSEIRKNYPNKTIIVCEGRVIKTFDKPIDPIKVNEIARKLCGDKDWSYAYVSELEEKYTLDMVFRILS